MREQNKDIAQRVRALREDSGVEAKEMAAVAGVPLERYLAYEAGREDIPASELSLVASRLRVDLGLLLTGETPKMTAFSVTRAGRGAIVDRRRGYGYENLASSFREAKFEPFVVTLPESAEGAVIPQNVHAGQEFNYMLEGRMTLKVHDNTVELDAGDSVIYDASIPHGMQAVGGPAKFIAIITV